MSETMSYRYSRAVLVKDGVLASVGLCIAVLPFLLARPGQIAAFVLGAIGVLALIFGFRTWLRGRTCFLLSADGLSRGPAKLAWDGITGFRLRHFSTRREAPDRGWMELTLSGPGGRISLDSGLEGFMEITRAAHGAALAKKVPFDPATQANLRALGLTVPDGGS